MPPKRKAATTAAAASAASSTSELPPRKKVRIGEESNIADDNTRESTPASTASGRAKRFTAAEKPTYNFTKSRGGRGGGRGGAASMAATRGKGAAAATVTATTPKARGGRGGRGAAGAGRGRAKGKVKEEKLAAPEPEAEPEPEDEINASGEAEKQPALKSILKNKDVNVNGIAPLEDGENDANDGAATASKRGGGRARGRPRGRGRGGARAAPASSRTQVEFDPQSALEVVVKTNAKSKGKGKRATASTTATATASKKLKLEEVDGLTDEEGLTKSAALAGLENVDPDVQYWLMKAEPESRIEKGVDVKFSIDDLAARTEPEGWDGVRNFVARNHMRAMRRGDLAFFYHSNCKVPGIVGVMRIVEEHSIDESAFDPEHPYYDPKSTDRSKPKWELVKVEFVKKFETMLTLKELRSFAGEGGVLQNMQMLKQGRLSVSSVSLKEWRFVLECVGEDVSLGQPERKSGYEGDDDGEGEEPIAADNDIVGDGDGVVAASSSDDAVGLVDGLDETELDAQVSGSEDSQEGDDGQELQDGEMPEPNSTDPNHTTLDLQPPGKPATKGPTVVCLSEVQAASGRKKYQECDWDDEDDDEGESDSEEQEEHLNGAPPTT